MFSYRHARFASRQAGQELAGTVGHDSSWLCLQYEVGSTVAHGLRTHHSRLLARRAPRRAAGHEIQRFERWVELFTMQKATRRVVPLLMMLLWLLVLLRFTILLRLTHDTNMFYLHSHRNAYFVYGTNCIVILFARSPQVQVEQFT